MFDSPEIVRQNMERLQCPYYAISDSKGNIYWINDEESDIQEAGELLIQDLKLIREGNTGTYIIKHYKKIPATGIKKSLEPDFISTYKRSTRTNYTDEQKKEYYGGIYQLLREQNEKLSMLETQIAVIKSHEEDEEDEDDEPEQSALGTIIGHPAIQAALNNFLTSLAANSFTNNNQAPPPAPPINNSAQANFFRVSGVAAGDDTEIIQIVKSLFAKGMTIEDLRKLNNMPDTQISFLLQMLRVQ